MRTSIYKYFLVISIVYSFLHADDYYLIQQLRDSAPICQEQVVALQKKALCGDTYTGSSLNYNASHLPLYKSFPKLFSHIAYISLGAFPTPVILCKHMSELAEHNIKLFIKDDGQCGKLLSDGTHLFGGNKVRKLEFALADAKKHEAQTVMTFGCVGSNHALATTVYAHELGLKSVCLLSNQFNSAIVQRNLLLQHYFQAQLHYYDTGALRKQDAYSRFLECYEQDGQFPYVIPTGASYSLGVLGFVSAAFELREQIQEGLLPEPDYIYVPAGSLGTLAGLMIGAKAAGLKTKIIGIAVQNIAQEVLEKRMLILLTDTNNLLHKADTEFPLYNWDAEEILVERDFAGIGYGIFTQEGTEAIRQLKEVEGIELDGVYSGKAFSGLLNHIRAGTLDNRTVLFWNTFCPEAFEQLTSSVEYDRLQPDFKKYFEHSKQ